MKEGFEISNLKFNGIPNHPSSSCPSCSVSCLSCESLYDAASSAVMMRSRGES